MNIENTCFFSGHRYIPRSQIDIITESLKNSIIYLVRNGVTNFIAGGALGFDTLCADTIINMQSNSIEFAQKVRLSLYLPCYDQTKNWSWADKYHFNMIKFHASDYRYITESPYTKDCMKLRNFAMVDNAKWGIVYCTKIRSGTHQTISYANRVGRSIINIAP